MFTIIYLIVIFLLVIVWSFFLRITASGYPFGIFKPFFQSHRLRASLESACSFFQMSSREHYQTIQIQKAQIKHVFTFYRNVCFCIYISKKLHNRRILSLIKATFVLEVDSTIDTEKHYFTWKYYQYTWCRYTPSSHTPQLTFFLISDIQEHVGPSHFIDLEKDTRIYKLTDNTMTKSKRTNTQLMIYKQHYIETVPAPLSASVVMLLNIL